MEELWDELDEQGNPTGRKITKKEAHGKGLWHACVHVWIYNDKAEILVQKRSQKMDICPGLWDISSAGHLSSGEDPIECAAREASEELNLKIPREELKKVGYKKMSTRLKSTFKKDFIHTEFVHVYLWKYDNQDFSKDNDEVEEVKFIPLKQFEKECKDESKYVPHKEYYDFIVSEINKEL
jgi:isopentenyldiphosphate isomerase